MVSNAVPLGLLGVVGVLYACLWEAELFLCCGVGVVLDSGIAAAPPVAWDRAASSSGLGVLT